MTATTGDDPARHTTRAEAVEALRALLAELPVEFSEPLGDTVRHEFRVIKQSNVRRVHKALWTLQEHFGR